MISQLIAVFIGGGLGASARFLVTLSVADHLPKFHGFPIGTMFCNVTGSFLIGILAAYAAGNHLETHPLFRHLILIGLLGGYTTFSSFSLETITLLQNGKALAAGLMVVGTVCLCLFGAALGSTLGNLLRNT